MSPRCQPQEQTRATAALNVGLLGDFHRVVDFDAQISDRILDLGVPEQQLYCMNVLGLLVDQRRFDAAHCVSSIRDR